MSQNAKPHCLYQQQQLILLSNYRKSKCFATLTNHNGFILTREHSFSHGLTWGPLRFDKYHTTFDQLQTNGVTDKGKIKLGDMLCLMLLGWDEENL